MDQTVSQQHKSNIDKSKRMLKLLDNPDFNDLFIEGFITQGIVNQVLQNRIDNSLTLDELKARQIVHKYIFDVIATGEKSEHN